MFLSPAKLSEDKQIWIPVQNKEHKLKFPQQKKQNIQTENFISGVTKQFAEKKRLNLWLGVGFTTMEHVFPSLKMQVNRLVNCCCHLVSKGS